MALVDIQDHMYQAGTNFHPCVPYLGILSIRWYDMGIIPTYHRCICLPTLVSGIEPQVDLPSADSISDFTRQPAIHKSHPIRFTGKSPKTFKITPTLQYVLVKDYLTTAYGFSAASLRPICSE